NVHDLALDQEAVERAIDDFYKRGEAEWINDKPADKEQLVKLYNEIFKMTNCSSAEIKISSP
ncbi:hypothetical protein, partial [Pectobacterium aquaticum]|uniref:hypothetical protein n=1 Tax=Pectobacterium aquaticum TaxID=2204145 RepID=UPI000E383211